MDLQIMGREPLSRFMLGMVFLIRMALPIGMASTIFCQNPSAHLWTVVPSRLMHYLADVQCHSWCVLVTCCAYTLYYITYLYISVWVGF